MSAGIKRDLSPPSSTLFSLGFPEMPAGSEYFDRVVQPLQSFATIPPRVVRIGSLQHRPLQIKHVALDSRSLLLPPHHELMPIADGLAELTAARR